MKFPLRQDERPQPLQRQSQYFPQNQSLAGSLQLVPGGNIRIGQSNYNVGTGLWVGLVDGVPKLSLGVSTGNHLTWDGDSLDITGVLTATSGTIGGFTIGSTSITATNLTLDSSGQRITLGSTNDIVILDADDATYRLWIGNATAASAPFRVSKAGAVTATDITITGGSVATSTFSGLVALANQNIATQGWTQTCAFSVTDADTVAWGAGTFTTAGGTSYSIGAGNTGNMAARTYIYLDIGVSTTAYQTTTTASSAVGAGKVLVATAINGTTEARFEVFGGVGGLNIDAANIVAGTITANEIAASTITAGKLSISTLSAITADLGTITAGTITLNASGHLKSGQTAYNTGTGFFLGIDSGTAKFSIGNSAGSSLLWDGTSLTLDGDFNVDTFRIVQNTSTTQLLTGVYNLSNTAGSHSIHEISVAGSSAGNPQTLYNVSGIVQWRIGIANDDDDSLAIGTDISAGSFYMKFVEDASINLNYPLFTLASSTTGASIRLPHGTAPTSPVNGDMWTTTAGLFVRINGATVGPLS